MIQDPRASCYMTTSLITGTLTGDGAKKDKGKKVKLEIEGKKNKGNVEKEQRGESLKSRRRNKEERRGSKKQELIQKELVSESKETERVIKNSRGRGKVRVSLKWSWSPRGLQSSVVLLLMGGLFHCCVSFSFGC